MNPIRTKRRNAHRPARGFTLLEIMVVAAIVVILSWLAMVVIGRIKERAVRSLIVNNLRQLYDAKEYYYTETGSSQVVSVALLAQQGYAAKSLNDRLFSNHSFESGMGWHYNRVMLPGLPAFAYKGTRSANLPPTGEIIFYPGPPSILADLFPGLGSQHSADSAAKPVASGSGSSANPPQAKPSTPVATQPPAGYKGGSTPTSPWVLATAVALPPVREDTPRTFTEAELLKLVGAGNPGGSGALGVTGVTIDRAAGTMVKQADGSWVFTPSANYHASNLDLNIKVSNGNGETTAQAHLDVTPVTDPAGAKLGVVAEQPVMKFGAEGTGAVMNQGNLQGGGPMDALAVEFTVIGGPQVQTVGSHGATFISYATTHSNDEFYVWRPENLTVRLGGHEYATGIDTTRDTESHRYSVLWQSATGGLDVLVDGVVAKHLDNIAKGSTIPGDGKLVLAQDQDAYGGGFSPNDAFRGQIFNAAMARAHVDASQLANNNLGNALHGSNDLIIDIQAQGAGFIDTTGKHQIETRGSIVSANVMVDTSIASPNPGARLRLDTLVTDPSDKSDTVSGATLSGFAAGTVISDGPLHVHTFTGPGDIINLRDWTVSTLTAQLPVSTRENMDVRLTVTTTGPDGHTAESTSTAPVRFTTTAHQ